MSANRTSGPSGRPVPTGGVHPAKRTLYAVRSQSKSVGEGLAPPAPSAYRRTNGGSGKPPNGGSSRKPLSGVCSPRPTDAMVTLGADASIVPVGTGLPDGPFKRIPPHEPSVRCELNERNTKSRRTLVGFSQYRWVFVGVCRFPPISPISPPSCP